MTIPPQEVIDALLAGVTRVTRRLDIYESDGDTLYYPGAPLIDGTVTIDASSSESRRTLAASIYGDEDALRRHPGGLWYDKIIKPYRGVDYTVDGVHKHYEWQLGEFMIDNIASKNFPETLAITGRDYAKRLVKDKFGVPTSFSQFDSVASTIRVIAINGGINPNKMDFTAVDPSDVVGSTFTFEPDDTRWKAVTDIANAYNYDIFFNGEGNMIVKPFGDPATSDPVFSFASGERGTLASYDKSVGDGRLYNDVVVTGEGVDPPVVGRASVTDPNSPVNIDRIGRRTYRYNSGFIYTQLQADLTALSFLRTVSLEEYTVSIQSLVIPWLEGGDIIDFVDPKPDPGQAVRFLLHDFAIKFALGTMSVNANRVLAVG